MQQSEERHSVALEHKRMVVIRKSKFLKKNHPHSSSENDDGRHRVTAFPSTLRRIILLAISSSIRHRLILVLIFKNTDISVVESWKTPEFVKRITKPRGSWVDTILDNVTSRSNTTTASASSTSLSDPQHEPYERCGVRPAIKAPEWVWKATWRFHERRLLPILHFRDAAHAKDSKKSLLIQWLKALVAVDPNSPVYEYDGIEQRHNTVSSSSSSSSSVAIGWTCALLPYWSSHMMDLLLRRLQLVRLFPRLYHAPIELRTAYLNAAIEEELKTL